MYKLTQWIIAGMLMIEMSNIISHKYRHLLPGFICHYYFVIATSINASMRVFVGSFPYGYVIPGKLVNTNLVLYLSRSFLKRVSHM